MLINLHGYRRPTYLYCITIPYTAYSDVFYSMCEATNYICFLTKISDFLVRIQYALGFLYTVIRGKLAATLYLDFYLHAYKTVKTSFYSNYRKDFAYPLKITIADAICAWLIIWWNFLKKILKRSLGWAYTYWRLGNISMSQ